VVCYNENAERPKTAPGNLDQEIQSNEKSETSQSASECCELIEHHYYRRVAPLRSDDLDRPLIAFTLVELLVAVAIIAILASMLLPALTKSKESARSVQCVNNLRELTLAWNMYPDDFNGRLVWNDLSATGTGWVRGMLDYDGSNTDNTNSIYLTDSRFALLAPYSAHGAGIYRCPSDRSTVTIGGSDQPRVRSLSLSQAMNSKDDWMSAFTATKYVVFRKLSDVGVMGHSLAYTFIDENPDSINFGDFAVAMNDDLPDSKIYIIDVPGSYHSGVCNLSFADSHVERHKWLDARTKPPVKGIWMWASAKPSPGNVDMRYLSAHTSVRK
jgi:prepilin-type N-terminal cleavage/methylation domain-containing protein/prepilin-type processing-associated H-X9-DG protein